MNYKKMFLDSKKVTGLCLVLSALVLTGVTQVYLGGDENNEATILSSVKTFFGGIQTSVNPRIVPVGNTNTYEINNSVTPVGNTKYNIPKFGHEDGRPILDNELQEFLDEEYLVYGVFGINSSVVPSRKAPVDKALEALLKNFPNFSLQSTDEKFQALVAEFRLAFAKAANRNQTKKEQKIANDRLLSISQKIDAYCRSKK